MYQNKRKQTPRNNLVAEKAISKIKILFLQKHALCLCGTCPQVFPPKVEVRGFPARRILSLGAVGMGAWSDSRVVGVGFSSKMQKR